MASHSCSGVSSTVGKAVAREEVGWEPQATPSTSIPAPAPAIPSVGESPGIKHFKVCCQLIKGRLK